MISSRFLSSLRAVISASECCSCSSSSSLNAVSAARYFARKREVGKAEAQPNSGDKSSTTTVDVVLLKVMRVWVDHRMLSLATCSLIMHPLHAVHPEARSEGKRGESKRRMDATRALSGQHGSLRHARKRSKTQHGESVSTENLRPLVLLIHPFFRHPSLCRPWSSKLRSKTPRRGSSGVSSS